MPDVLCPPRPAPRRRPTPCARGGRRRRRVMRRASRSPPSAPSRPPARPACSRAAPRHAPRRSFAPAERNRFGPSLGRPPRAAPCRSFAPAERNLFGLSPGARNRRAAPRAVAFLSPGVTIRRVPPPGAAERSIPCTRRNDPTRRTAAGPRRVPLPSSGANGRGERRAGEAAAGRDHGAWSSRRSTRSPRALTPRTRRPYTRPQPTAARQGC